MKPVTVELIMTKKVFKVRMDDTIGTIREIFENVKFHHLLVVDGKQLVGVISDRDVLKAISPFLDTLSEHTYDLATLNRKAHQIMAHKPVTVYKGMSVKMAANILLNNNISCIPVISPEGNIEGIVTWKDILRYYVKDNEELF
jgi:acetoin utilization protein AcuB